MAQDVVKKSSAAAVALAWLIVVVPAGWGLTYTVQNAMKIFTAGAPVVAAPVAATPTSK
jgi:hypothetical protein